MRPLRRGVAALAAMLAALGLVGCSGPAAPDSPADRDGTPPDAAATSTSGASPAPGFRSVVGAVEDRVEVYDGIATGAIALVRVGDRTRVVTAGRADKADDRAMSARLTFPIASITKPMTATLVLQLVDEGRIRLDDPVRRWVPELDAIRSPITVEQVLSHHAGVREVGTAEVERVGFGTSALVTESARRGPEFRPGSKGVYSNVGFAALGLLVERVLHQPLAEALADRVFAPAGMQASSLGDPPDVQGYVDGEPVEDYFFQFLPAAGSVVASAGDVDRFFGALWAGTLLPDDLVTEMRRSRGQVRVGLSWRPDYGLGLIRWSTRCGTAIGHSGRIGGFTLEAWTLEDTERATVVAVNDQDADEIARGIAGTALCGAA